MYQTLSMLSLVCTGCSLSCDSLFWSSFGCSNSYLTTPSIYLWCNYLCSLATVHVSDSCKSNHLNTHHWPWFETNYVQLRTITCKTQIFLISEVVALHKNNSSTIKYSRLQWNTETKWIINMYNKSNHIELYSAVHVMTYNLLESLIRSKIHRKMLYFRTLHYLKVKQSVNTVHSFTLCEFPTVSIYHTVWSWTLFRPRGSPLYN